MVRRQHNFLFHRVRVRQGCPLAPYLFLVVGKVLNQNIDREVEAGRIKGISLSSLTAQQMVGQYADDTSLMLRGEDGTVLQAVLTFKEFSLAS